MPARATIYVKLVLTALFWGATWIAGRVAVQEAAPLTIASWRFFIASLALGALLLTNEKLPRWSTRDWLLLGALGLTGVFLYNMFFLYGLKQVEAGRGALVTALIPVLIAIADRLFFRQPMSRLRALGVAIALSGSLLVVSGGHPTRLLAGEVGFGELILLGSALAWVAYTLFSRLASRRFTPLAMTFGGCLTGWIMLTCGALAEGTLFAFERLTWRGWSSIVFLGLIGTAAAFTWYSEAIKQVGSTKSAAFINLVPVFAVLLGAIILGERLPAAVLSGGALVIVGVFLTNRPSKA